MTWRVLGGVEKDAGPEAGENIFLFSKTNNITKCQELVWCYAESSDQQIYDL